MLKLKALLYATLLLSLMAVAPSAVTAKTGDIIARLGPGSNPKWSPDGKLIAFEREGSIWAINADGTGEPANIGNGYAGHFEWASNGTLILTKDKRRVYRSDTLRLFEISITRNEVDRSRAITASSTGRQVASAAGQRRPPQAVTGPCRLSNGTVGYFECPGSPLSPGHFHPVSFGSQDTVQWHKMRRVVTLEEGKDFATGFGDLWLVPIDIDDGPGRRLTWGRNFQTISATPGGDRIAAYEVERDGWVLIDSAGNELAPLFGVRRIFKSGFMSGATEINWAPDGTKFTYLQLVEAADTSVAETLCVYVLRENRTEVLLNDTHGTLYLPAWSPSGNEVAVPTSKSGILVVEVR